MSQLQSPAPPARAPRLARRALTAAALSLAGGLGALVAPHRRASVLLGVATLAGALVLSDPLVLSVAVAPGALLLQRVGGSAAGSSVDLSDVILLAGTAVALPMICWRRAGWLWSALRFGLAYELLTLPVVAYHPFSHDLLEWVHRLLLVSGALVVGWAVAVAGRARQALSAFVGASMVLAVITCVVAAQVHLKAAQFGAYQKNYIGTVMWVAVVIAHVNPSWADLDRRLARPAKYLCTLALLATHSKQSIAALLVAVGLALLLQRNLRRRSKLLLVSLVPLAVFAYLVVMTEVRSKQINALTIRGDLLAGGMHVWRLSPWLGQGLHWFYLPQYSSSYAQPPNMEVGALASGGVLGLVAIVVLLVGLGTALRRLPKPVGTLALCVLVGRVAQTQFDLFWVSASGMLPFLVAGMALGVADHARSITRGVGLAPDELTAQAARDPGGEQ